MTNTGTHFRHILNFLRDRRVSIALSESEVEALAVESKYYLIEDLMEELRSVHAAKYSMLRGAEKEGIETEGDGEKKKNIIRRDSNFLPIIIHFLLLVSFNLSNSMQA